MADSREDFETIRQIHTVLVLHFVDGMKQNDIAAALNLSASKVNRLIAQGRKLGMLRIAVESPFQALVNIEKQLIEIARLAGAIVTPTVAGSPESTLQQVGRAAANQLLETLRDGDVIAITGGKAISALAENLQPERVFDVTVVPLTGGVQGKHYTDVNHLATRLAERLGGSSMLLHAPLFAESREQRDLLLEMASVREIFDLARKAAIALVGIGSIQTPGSSYYDLRPGLDPDREKLVASGAVGEFLAHLIRDDGTLADYPPNDRLVALAPSELGRCRTVMGVASGAEKVGPIRAALRGNYLKSLVVDEETANAVLNNAGSLRNVA
ncbi:sugar-binding transcriptional regulator [Mesorhizobium sp. M4B.F.Ca.ET.017.02.2.1]|uniref:sugar-binding transcriptional regulator n=1 Tax=Mesorhizobium sp. M4B.F.Ca.ET.017.02.2.1 TaxID=2496649 RepID=UPI000FCCCCB1|nr:sugar-binding transcriptional regulator [Mesorhizobium sp. M4B.F.Ca.ET.017.02.2.1]RVD31602.1 sugar-binding transcriptional regulator [Mesorhizobium sp. M4B.F.Ca.ET.017.02.2.1]